METIKKTEEFIKKHRLGYGLLVKFKGDSRTYTIKEINLDRKKVWVLYNYVMTTLKPINKIVSIGNKKVEF